MSSRSLPCLFCSSRETTCDEYPDDAVRKQAETVYRFLCDLIGVKDAEVDFFNQLCQNMFIPLCKTCSILFRELSILIFRPVLDDEKIESVVEDIKMKIATSALSHKSNNSLRVEAEDDSNKDKDSCTSNKTTGSEDAQVWFSWIQTFQNAVCPWASGRDQQDSRKLTLRARDFDNPNDTSPSQLQLKEEPEEDVSQSYLTCSTKFNQARNNVLDYTSESFDDISAVAVVKTEEEIKLEKEEVSSHESDSDDAILNNIEHKRRGRIHWLSDSDDDGNDSELDDNDEDDPDWSGAEMSVSGDEEFQNFVDTNNTNHTVADSDSSRRTLKTKQTSMTIRSKKRHNSSENQISNSKLKKRIYRRKRAKSPDPGQITTFTFRKFTTRTRNKSVRKESRTSIDDERNRGVTSMTSPTTEHSSKHKQKTNLSKTFDDSDEESNSEQSSPLQKTISKPEVDTPRMKTRSSTHASKTNPITKAKKRNEPKTVSYSYPSKKKQGPFECDLCDQKFAFLNSVKRHVGRFHSDKSIPKREYKKERVKCSHCDAIFHDTINLERHFHRIHNGPRLQKKVSQSEIKERKRHCRYCKEVFLDPSNLNRHMKAVHLNCRLYECTDCKRTFNRSDNLDMHRKRYHSS